MKKAIIFYLIFLFCNDPIFNRCDQICNFVGDCTKQNLSSEMYPLLENVYPYCINACMTYYLQISECYQVNKENSCKEVFDCMFPVLIHK